jgi:hypothetical protein
MEEQAWLVLFFDEREREVMLLMDGDEVKIFHHLINNQCNDDLSSRNWNLLCNLT